MYLNFKYAAEKQLSPYDIITLQTIKQMRSENLEDVLASLLQDDRLCFYVEKGYVTQIKGSKNDTEIGRLRLSKAGMKLLDNIETAEVTEEVVVIFDWMAQFYKSDEEKFIGNMKRTKQGIANFSKETGIQKNCLAFLIQTFLNSDSMEYSYKMENLFFSSKNLYSRKFNLEECRLYDFYKKREEWFEKKFAHINN